ncbi:MAG TPA: HlyD family secretion protein, partial [Burkholderiaceae bacterium]|nr:HlyD family secretion protein [Burkholderiaceae bacterium]
MEILLLGIYTFFVWLIFIKFKWLPWNIYSQVTVVVIPIVALTALILSLNVFAPSSSDVRVYRYVVPIVSQVRGRVIEVPIEEGNRPVKKGDVLFRIDPTPYQLQVNVLEAQLANAIAQQKQLGESLKGAKATVAGAQSSIAAAEARTREVSAKYELARRRVEQNRELVATGAGSKFDLEQAETNFADLTSQLAAAKSNELQARAGEAQAVAGQGEVQSKLGATVKGEFAQVAQIRAQLENAKWELEQTTTKSPCDCYVVNLQIRPGGFVAGLPLNPVLTLVESTGSVVALFSQNELHQVEPGNEAEFALQTIPGRIIKAKVDSVIWASGAGQVQATGTLPMTGVLTAPPQRFAVKFDIADKDKELFLAAGAAGAAAIYTEHAEFLHIIRKVILRVGSYLNYLVLKL